MQRLPDFLSKEDQLLVNRLADCLWGLDPKDYGALWRRALESGFSSETFDRWRYQALWENENRRRYQAWLERNQARCEIAERFAEAGFMDSIRGAIGVAACAVMAVGFTQVIPFVWAVFV